MFRTFLLLIVLTINLPVFGQMYIIFNRLSKENGLNTNNVNCTWQDNKGFLWIGTQNGLQRFDGRKFISFITDGLDHSIPTFGVDQILDAGDGKMWLRQGNLIGLFDPVTFHYSGVSIKYVNQLPVQSELNLYRDSKGNTYLCTHRTGLLYYNKSENQFTAENLPISVPNGWIVNSIFEDTVTGDYWISGDKGLAIFQDKTKTLFSLNNNPNQLPLLNHNDLTSVYRFFIDQDRTYWIIQWDLSPEIEPVLIHFDSFGKKILENVEAFQSAGTEYQGFFWINKTRAGQLWFGGVNSLVCFDFKLNAFIQNKKINPGEYDINFREIKQLYEDRENNIWLSTNNGLYVVTPEQKSVFNVVLTELNQGNDIVINSIQETTDLENWIGTWENGILVYDKFFRKTNHDLYKTLHPDNQRYYKQVWDLYQHSKSGLIWSGCQNGSIVIFDPRTKKPVKFLEPSVFEHAPIRQIMEDQEGNLFFGTQKGRLVKWQNGSEISNDNFEVIHDFNSSIYILYKDNKNHIWVGTRHMGLFVMDSSGNNLLSRYNEQPGLITYLGNSFYDVVQYNDSIFFVSTGLLNILNLNSGEIKTLTQYDGLPGTGITQLLLDNEGILWFNNNNGLGSYNYQKNIFALYDERDGIIMGNKSINTKFKMKNGEFWFGGENALFGFRPESLINKTAPPKVTITDFKLFDTYIPLDSLIASEKIRFGPDQNSFTIYFSSLSFTQQDKLLYYYKMDGVDNDWVKAESNLAANYTILAPGKYTFNVKCVNMQGVESAGVTTLKFSVSPHFYQSRWFLSLIILFSLGLTYLFYRMRLNRLLAVEIIRNKVARDLHDDVGSTLSTINILSSMAKTKLLTDPVKTSEYISKITDNSQHMMEAMDDIVWSIKPDNDNMQRIVARMREYASSILEPKDIEIDFIVEGNIEDLKLNMETRRDVFLIFKEALNNSAKYSYSTRIKIRIAFDNKKLTIQISDNGNGFDIKKADSGNGLGNMQKRAEAFHGNINISSEEGKGTKILLNVPVTN